MTEALFAALWGAPNTRLPRLVTDRVDVFDDDAQLALTCAYELHYAGFADVDDRWEWAPSLLEYRSSLEDAFLRRLYDEVGVPAATQPTEAVDQLRELATASTGPSLSQFMEQHGALGHMREFCVHRSEYQRKEADPHTWMVPRLRGRAKAAAISIQYDEYGSGDAAAMHAELFAETMSALALDPSYGTYRGLLPATTLATGNLVSMFGLHRRLRAACVGHLALFEMTSVGPMGRYAAAIRRLGLGAEAARFYTVHVEADAWHEQIAQHDLTAGFLEGEPAEAGMVVFGARALAEIERRMSDVILDAWAHDRTSLLAPIPSLASAG